MYDNTFDNISIGEKARECLPLSETRKDGNHYICPLCSGLLWVKNDSHLSCVTSNCTGIYKEINRIYNGGSYVAVNRKESAPKPEGIRLPAKDRDKAIRSIIHQLPLETVDRDDLVKKRGLSDEQIRKYGFFTTKNGFDRNNNTCLDYPVNSDLAGIAIDGLHFTARGACYNIPIQNVYGQYVSFKIKPRDPGNGGKYLTAVSKEGKDGKGRKVRAESHTAEFGCIPLQHTILDRSPGKPLFFSEGELKGIIIAERHGGNTVSASGSQFLLNNGIELANTLDVLQPSECILFPDAGMLDNPSILKRYRELRDFLLSAGYNLLIADWGQGHADKKVFPDGDEIESGAYKIISFSEWDDQPQQETPVYTRQSNRLTDNSKPVNKLEIEVKGVNGFETRQITDAKKELEDHNLEQLERINPFSPVLRICNKPSDNKAVPQVIIPDFFNQDDLIKLLNLAKMRVKYSLYSLSLKQIKALLKQYGLKGFSVFTKTDLLTGKMPPKLKRDESGKIIKNDKGEAEIEVDVSDKPVDRYSADEFAVLTNLHQALKNIDLSKHKALFDTTKEIHIDLLVEHPAKTFIANKVNEKFNTSAFKKQVFTCHFRLDSLADKPFLKKEQWTKNSIDAFDKDPVNLEQFLLWQRLNTFTADIHDNTQYISNSDVFSNIDLLDGSIHLLAGGLGGGKTTDLIKKIVDLIVNATAKSERPLKILFAGYRLNLNANTINKIKCALINKAHEIGIDTLLGKQLLDVSSYIYDSDVFKKKFGFWSNCWKADKRLILFCCVDSLPQCVQRMQSECQEDMLIVMDECDAVAKHMVKGSTCKGKRTRILEGFDKLLSNCLGVYGLSGTLNDATKQLFEGCGKEIITYQNDYLPEPTTIQLSIGYGDVDFLTEIIKLKQSELSQILDEIIERVNNGERLIICSDSQQQNERLERLIRDKCGDIIIVRIDADTKIDPARQADVASIMADPGRVIPEKNIQVLIYNSSAESGVDMSFAPDHQKYFDKLFGFSFNVIGTNAMIQLLKRYRHKLDLFMWCSAGKNSQTDMPAIPAHRVNEVRMERKDNRANRDDRTNLRYNNARRIEGSVPIGHTENKFTRFANDLEFMEKFERRHPRICLQWMLQKHGYNVQMMYTTEKTGTDTSEQKKQIIAEKVKAILDASDEYIGKPIEDDQNITTLDQKYAIAKATILRQLSYSKDDYQRDDVPLFNPEIVELIGVTNKGYVNTIKNWVYVDLPEAELKLLQRFDHKSETFLNDVRVMQRPMKWIKDMGLPAILTEIKNSPADGDMLQISVNDKRLNKIQKWASYKTNNDKWRLLTGSFYQEKMFIFQLSKLMSNYFGVKVFVKDKVLFVKPDEHRGGIMARVAIGIEQKIFRYKVQRYFFTKKKEWAEVVNDARFSYEYKQVADRYEQNYATGDFDWIIAETNYDDHVATWEDPDYSESATRSDKGDVEVEVDVVASDTATDTPTNTIECTTVPVVPLPVPAMMALSNTNVAVLDRITITESLEAGCYMAITPTLSDHQLNIADAVVRYQGKTFTPHTRHDDGAETSIIFECGREYIAVQYYNAPPTQLWQAKAIVNITSALNTNWWQF